MKKGECGMKKAFLLLMCLIAAVFFAACAEDMADQLMTGAKPANEAALKVTGEYMGMSEGNSYELKIAENTYKVLVIPAGVRAAFDKLKLKSGDRVTAEYVVNSAGQLETINIERVKDDKDVTGKYVGLADNNSFEVLVEEGENDKSMVFRITDKVRGAFEKLGLKKNDIVTINYTENKDGQLLVNSIKKTG